LGLVESSSVSVTTSEEVAAEWHAEWHSDAATEQSFSAWLIGSRSMRLPHEEDVRSEREENQEKSGASCRLSRIWAI